MADNRMFDGLEFTSLDLPYNRVIRELSDEPRLVAGLNTFVTPGGKLAKRPGTRLVSSTANTTVPGRCDRLWLYETLDNPTPYVYLVGSFYDSGTARWRVHYIRLDAPGTPAWTLAGTLRDLNASTRAHEACVSRGLLYIKGYPASGSSEKLGTVIFDGTGGSVAINFWGLLGPSQPARITGAVTTLNGAISASTTSFSLTSATGLPATPFNIQLDYELITVNGLSGTTVTSCLRGAQGTIPAGHVDKTTVLYRNWTASAHPVAVNMYWEYSYAWKTNTGQISNRAPLETNPDNRPSSTGPFLNLLPKITVRGHADTTRVPKIIIYRTTDGGGTLFKLEEITNTGDVDITYEDKSLASGSGSADPIPDKNLNTQEIAPTLNSNSPTPTVVSPLVTGTATPAGSTPITSYSGRLWLAIGNTLFYSANEELNTGIPEESFPSGTFGNFYKFQFPVVGIEGTTDALYVVTTQTTYQITGSNKETFDVRPILTNIGGASNQPRAFTKYGDALVWLTNDLRIAILQGTNYRTISGPLWNDYVSIINNFNAEIDIHYWADLEREWIVLSAICPNPENSRQWIYDVEKSVALKQDFWNTPWTIKASAVASGRVMETIQQRRLLFATWDGTSGLLSRISTTSEVKGSDDYPGSTNTPFDFWFRTSLFQIPPGNHVNALRRPGLLPIIYDFFIERTKYEPDTDPDVYYYIDDLWTNPIPTIAEDAARGETTLGYRQLFYPVQSKGRRVGITVQKLASKEPFELQNFVILFNADQSSNN